MGYVLVGVCICGRELRPFIENKKPILIISRRAAIQG